MLEDRSAVTASFDPIAVDSAFVIVNPSSYWPPPTLASLREAAGFSGEAVVEDGFDMYDRRDEERQAKKEKMAALKKKGELHHPRGKERKNTVETLDDSSSEAESDG